jgi:chromosomal replication initiation ATPase DnaA
MPPDPNQLPLPFQHQPRYDSVDFIHAESNRAARAWLEAEWPDRRLALFGPPGCGKSHLLHIWARQTAATVLAGQTLAAQTLADLDTIPQHGALALDDGDLVRDETLLFHLLNTARDRGLRLLIAARTAPARWPVRLPDLSSRLRAIAAVEIHEPDDELLAALLQRLIADRQLIVTQPARDWILIHCPRSPSALREAVARLDRESLIFGGPVTRTLAARVLKDDGLDEFSASGPSLSSDCPGFLYDDLLSPAGVGNGA